VIHRSFSEKRGAIRRAVFSAAVLVSGSSACGEKVEVRLLEKTPPGLGGAGVTSFGGVAGSDGAQGTGAELDAGSEGSAGAGAVVGGSPDASIGDSLIHRYDFAGTGTVVADLVGGADGTLEGGATLDGDGWVTLDGADDYVNLPNGLISSLTSVTLVAWLEWDGGVCWQRIFDFGSNDQGEDMVGNGTSSLFLTPANCPRSVLELSLELASVRIDLLGPQSMPSTRAVQVAVVIDGESEEAGVYLDGAPFVEAVFPLSLGEVDDVNAWLGRSQWVQDFNLRGRYDEFRIYSAALAPDQIEEIWERGPDAP
jgi:hypothetical protein